MANEVIFNSVNGEVVRNVDDDLVIFTKIDYSLGDVAFGGVVVMTGSTLLIANQRNSIAGETIVGLQWTTGTTGAPGSTGIYLGATGQTIFEGQINNEIVLAAEPTAPAFIWTAALTDGGYNDWYVPNVDELRAVRDENHKQIWWASSAQTLDLSWQYYWTSSENEPTSEGNGAYVIRLSNAYTDLTAFPKNWNTSPYVYVCAVRKQIV